MTSGAYTLRCHAIKLLLAGVLVWNSVYGSATLSSVETSDVAQLQVNSTVLDRSGDWFEVKECPKTSSMEALCDTVASHSSRK